MQPSHLEQKVSFLKKVKLFDGLSSRQLELIAERFRIRKYRNRDTIFYQGDTTSEFCVICSGKVRIITVNENGDEACLRVLGAGDVVGELAANDGEPRSATAQAIGACTIMVMHHGDFKRCLTAFPELALALVHFLSDKLRWTTYFFHTLAQYDAAGRLIHQLMDYKDKFGREIAAGKIYEIDLALNQTELASLVGTRREWLNRLLQQWRKRGLIQYRRGSITILDLPSLIQERDKRQIMFREGEF